MKFGSAFERPFADAESSGAMLRLDAVALREALFDPCSSQE